MTIRHDLFYGAASVREFFRGLPERVTITFVH
jgi:hypothetical protein